MSHCCFAGCDLLECGCCKNDLHHCEHYGSTAGDYKVRTIITTTCRLCGNAINPYDYKFGSKATGWQHMECPDLIKEAYTTSLEKKLDEKWGTHAYAWALGRGRTGNGENVWLWTCGIPEGEEELNTWEHFGSSDTIEEALQAMLDIE